MNLIIFAIMSFILANHFGDSSIWPLRADVWSSSRHQVVRRATIPYWLKALRETENGRLNWDDRLRKNRDAEGNKGIFSGLDSPVVSEAYIQPARKENVIASNSKYGDNMRDAVIFGDDNTEKAVVNGAEVESGSSSIDFGVQDRMKNGSPQSLVGRPLSKTNSSANADNNRSTSSNKSEMTNVSSSVNFIDQPDWTPVVNESQCQSTGPTMFCEDVPNYPEEAIRQILMSDKGSLLTNFFTDNTAQPLPSASESDETMVVAQRKPGAPVTVQAINTRNKESSSKDYSLCETTTKTYAPKTGKNIMNELRYIVNQNGTTQFIEEEICRNVNEPCSNRMSIQSGDSTACRQKYIITKLAAVKDGKIVYEDFRIPSCCVCVGVPLVSLFTSSMARRSLAMPSSFQRMAAEVEGATIVA